jgi:hypothetical protein
MRFTPHQNIHTHCMCPLMQQAKTDLKTSKMVQLIFSKALSWGWISILLMIFTGCSTGYQIHRADGVETLYHIGGNGDKRIIYVVNDDGVLKVHDENDPLIQDFFSNKRLDDELALSMDKLKSEKTAHAKRIETQKLIRIGRIKAAKKRDETDPIHVAVHDTVLGPTILQWMGGIKKSQQRFKQFITEEMNTDGIIRIASHPVDVEIFFKSYLKETAALNIKTHKLVPVKAFHFEAYVQSNYLPGHRQTIKGLGHWQYRREVIKGTVHRVAKFIKEEIGVTIPKNRKPFLTTNYPSV